MVNIESPFKGIPPSLLWISFGVIFLLIGAYLIVIFGFSDNITIIGTSIGIFISLIGSATVGIGFAKSTED